MSMLTVFMFFSACMLTLVALGLIPDMRSDTPVLAFCVAIPFAAVIFGVCISICWVPIKASGIAAGRSYSQLLGKLATLLIDRPTIWSLFASVTPLLLVAQYWETETGFLLQLPGTSEVTLIHAMRIEFLLIHGYPFLIFWALLAISRLGMLRIVGGLIFLLVAALYTGAAINIDGSFYGALIFLYLLIPDLISFARSDPDEYVRPRLAMRWCLQFFGMLFALIVTNSQFLQNSSTFLAGGLFFGWITFMELFRVADIPLDIAYAWNREASTWALA
jgi:hypothetical protein